MYDRIGHGPHLPTSLVVQIPTNHNLLCYLWSTFFLAATGKSLVLAKLYLIVHFTLSNMGIDEVDTDFLRLLTMHRCRKDAGLFYQCRLSLLIFLSKKPLENLVSLGIAVTKRRALFKPLFMRTVVAGSDS